MGHGSSSHLGLSAHGELGLAANFQGNLSRSKRRQTVWLPKLGSGNLEKAELGMQCDPSCLNVCSGTKGEEHGEVDMLV